MCWRVGIKMDKMWKIIAEKKDNVRFCQNASYSPYSESSLKWMVQEEDVIKIAINSFYRFDGIMQPLFKEDRLTKEYQDWIFDIYMHYLTELEYRGGVTIQELHVRKYWKALENGSYGDKIRCLFNLLSSEKKYYISHMLWKQEETRETVNKYAEALVTILNGGIVYKNKLNEKQLLFYLNEKKSEDSLSKIEMIQQLFQPLGYTLHVFWENHFAVVGEEQTMIIDEMELL